MAISIQVKGLTSTRQFIKASSRETFILANKAISQAGFFIEGEVKQSIAGRRAEPRSVDTGRFLNSVKNVQSKPLTAKIESNVKYAGVLEFGTSRRRPRRHFSNTSKRNEKKVRDFVQRELKKVGKII